jgi:pimeloyl-ACP methyl ester carboxylesterase
VAEGRVRAPARILLFPGLDGTGRLFERFIAAAPADVSLTSIPLPIDVLSHDDLVERFLSTIPIDENTILLAESYSGPLAVRLAEQRRPRALVFCNSFVSPPRSRLLGWFARPVLLRVTLPPFLVRRYLVGRDADDELVREVASTIASVPPAALASRFRSLLEVDEAAIFSRCGVPVLYLRGTHDRVLSDASLRRMEAVRPVAVARVAGPHLLLQANPTGAWKAIESFLGGLEDQ